MFVGSGFIDPRASSLHDALPIFPQAYDKDFAAMRHPKKMWVRRDWLDEYGMSVPETLDELEEYRSEEHTSELQSRGHLVCRLLLEQKKVVDNLENEYEY